MVVVVENDEEIALFLELKRREADDNNLPALKNFKDLDGSYPSFSPISKTAADDFLKLQNDTTDYDWLLTPLDIPLFPSLEKETQKPTHSEIEKPALQTASFSIEPAGTLEDPLGDATFGLVASAPELIPTKAGNKDQSAPATRKPDSPKGKSATDKTSRTSTPSSHAAFPSTTKPKNLPTRSSTPNSSGSRSSTPTARARPSAPVTSRLSSRSSTPVHVTVTSSTGPGVSGPSCAGTMSAPSKLKNPILLRNKVPIVSSPGQPAVAFGVSVKAPLSSLTALPERPASAPRGRVLNSKTVSATSSVNGKPTQKSCSPSIVRTENSSGFNNRNFIAAWNCAHSNGTDYVNPVVIGTQMVERVVNMRKLAPPKPDRSCGLSNSSAKSASSRDGSGFGLSLSKKSLDMAIRHMSITAGVSGNLKPLNTKIGKSSGNSTTTETTKSSATDLSDSPFATSSNASSDPIPIIHFNSNYIDGNKIIEK